MVQEPIQLVVLTAALGTPIQRGRIEDGDIPFVPLVEPITQLVGYGNERQQFPATQ